jgi:hypothetical protein
MSYSILNELEAKKTELQKSLSQSEFQENDTDNTNVILRARLEEIISTSDTSTQRSNITTNTYRNDNDAFHFHPRVEPSSMRLIFDTRGLF